MKLFSLSKKSISLIIGLALVAGLVSFAFVPTNSVHAESILAITPRPTLNAAINQILSNIYHEEQNWLLIQQNNLSEANIILTKLGALITTAQNEGKDVSGLKSIQATLTSLINTAQSEHNSAAQILAAHNGFDGSGNVTNRTDAHNTLVAAQQPLLQAHLNIVQAAGDLRSAILAWRTKNLKPTPTTAGS
ncbi:MAG: hypothetical protein P4L50_11510 [Anaerolineaceae bacterium]|nr:hypothetical protein [Anaerolineaceae bacterium]